MQIPRIVIVAKVGLTLLLATATSTAAELKALIASGIRPVIQDLAPQFERATGHTMSITYASAGAALKQLQDGQTFDFVIIPRQGMDSLVRDGRASAANTGIFARSGIGVAVRKGTPKPDISSAEALKRALLGAKAITYSRPEDGGASGIHFAKVLERLGIANEMKPKTVFDTGNNVVGLMVANGRAEIGVHQIQELVSIDGIELVGPLPGDLQDNIVWAAAIMSNTKELDAGKKLIDFLRTPAGAAVIRAKGMEPATP